MRRPFMVMVLSVFFAAVLAIGKANIAYAGDQPNHPVYLPIGLNHYKTGIGLVRGRVVDAHNRDPVGDAQVCFGQAECMWSNSVGEYQVENIPAGAQIFTVAKDGFIQYSSTATVLADNFIDKSFAMAPDLQTSTVQMRIVLTWDETETWPPNQIENDLDAHLWLAAPDPPTHIYPENPENLAYPGYSGDCTSFPGACLETEFRQGFGPETIAIQSLNNTDYYFGVLNYNQYQPGIPPIRQTSAEVRVYDQDGLLHTFSVPGSGDGNFWYVFKMIGQTGEIIPTDCVTDYPGDYLPECRP